MSVNVSYFASKTSAVVASSILTIGTITSFLSVFAPTIPGPAGAYVGAALTLLGGIKLALSGSVLPALRTVVQATSTLPVSPVIPNSPPQS